jgi:hypothetical protein
MKSSKPSLFKSIGSSANSNSANLTRCSKRSIARYCSTGTNATRDEFNSVDGVGRNSNRLSQEIRAKSTFGIDESPQNELSER